MYSKSLRVPFLLITIVFCTVFTAKAQSKPQDSKIINYTTVALDTHFNHKNKNVSIRLIVSNDTSKIYYAVIRPSDYYPSYLMSDRDPYFYFEYSDTLSSTLHKVVNKFREWNKIAIEHQTAELIKEIDVDIPIKYMSLRNYTNKKFKWASPSKTKFSFVLRDKQIGASISITEEIKDIELNQLCYLILTDADLEIIANLLDYNTLMKKLKTESENVLFK